MIKEHLFCFVTGTSVILLTASFYWAMDNIIIFRHLLLNSSLVVLGVGATWLLGFTIRSFFGIGGIHRCVEEDIHKYEQAFNELQNGHK